MVDRPLDRVHPSLNLSALPWDPSRTDAIIRAAADARAAEDRPESDGFRLATLGIVSGTVAVAAVSVLLFREVLSAGIALAAATVLYVMTERLLGRRSPLPG
jgi:hypothetical protein